jgi:hypothetical protein
MAVWLAVSLSELPALDACPVHGTGAAMPGGMPGAAHHHHGDSSDGRAPHQCNCTGGCCVACGTGYLPSAALTTGFAVPAAAHAPAPATPAWSPRPVAHRLPPAIGPPALQPA